MTIFEPTVVSHVDACAAARRTANPFVGFVVAIAVIASLAKATVAAERAAREEPGASVRAWEQIDVGRAFQAQSKLDEAGRAFDAARSIAVNDDDKWAQGAAINCSALLALREKRPDNAQKLLAPLPLDPVDPEAFVYRFNLGQALEQSKDPANAMAAFVSSLALRPDFEEAGDRIYRLLLNGPDAASAVSTIEQLLKISQPALAARCILGLLDKQPGRADGRPLLARLVQTYVARGVTASQFVDGEKLNAIAARSEDQSVRQRIALLVKTFGGGEPSPEEFGSWHDSNDAAAASAMSALLKLFGDTYAGNGKLEQAAARYLMAFRMDPANADAAIYYAATLRTYPDRVDPSGAALLGFLGQLFDAKSQVLRLPTQTRDDLMNLLRLHSILATIFEADHRFSADGPIYTAAYHWQRAIDVQEQIRRDVDPAFRESPKPYVMLARIQQENASTRNAAWTHFVQAAALYDDAAQKDQAAQIVTEAKALSPKVKLDTKQMDWFKEIEARVQKDVPKQPVDEKPKLLWLPSEYHKVGVRPDQIEKLNQINDKFEKQSQLQPARASELEKQKRNDLDNVLDAGQLDMVKQSRLPAAKVDK